MIVNDNSKIKYTPINDNIVEYKLNDNFPHPAKFNSDGGAYMKKSKTNIKLPEYIKSEDIVFKGENGNQDVFEIKFNKLDTRENDFLNNNENRFMSARLERNNKNL
jgi:hypothetical protein